MPIPSKPSIRWKFILRPTMKSQDGIGERFIPYKQFRRVSIIPNTLTCYTGLSHGAKLLWAILAQHAGEDGHAFPAVGTLAKEVGLKKRQTQILLSELKTKGFIESESGLRTNVYYFLMHPALVEKGMQDSASGDVRSCPSSMQNNAPKKTKEELQKKETTLPGKSRRVSFNDLFEEQQRYIELKTAYEAYRGKIHSSAAAFRAGLVKKALQGELDISGLKDLEAWKRSQGRSTVPSDAIISAAEKDGMRRATIERVKKCTKVDGRSPKELCDLLKEQGKERPPEGCGVCLINRLFWG